MAQARDVFPNIAAVSLTLSAANTLTYSQILTGVNLGQGVGMLIDRVEWAPSQASLADIDTDQDRIEFGLTTSNTLTNINSATDRRVILFDAIHRGDMGVAASAWIFRIPFIRDFAPPLLIASPYLYLAVTSVGMTVAAVINMRMYFRYIQLTAQEYIELAETFVLLG